MVLSFLKVKSVAVLEATEQAILYYMISLNHFCKIFRFFVRSSQITKFSLIERSIPISVPILTMQGKLPGNQRYFHAILTSFSSFPSVCGPNHIKKTHTAKEQAIISSGLYAFLKASLSCLWFTFAQIVMTAPFKYFNLLLQVI